MTKQSELFAFLALFFMLSVFFVERDRAKEKEKQAETPPIIVLSEEDATYRFDLGSAEVSPAFMEALRNLVVPLLDSLSEMYACDVIEVVGHTDGSVVGGSYSNLDDRLVSAFHEGAAAGLRPGSNLDLGMMRAAAITHIMTEQQRGGHLRRIRYFHPLSAGQMIRVDRTIAASDELEPDTERRRIEIRLLRSPPGTTAPAFVGPRAGPGGGRVTGQTVAGRR
jgi:hypothetical protein